MTIDLKNRAAGVTLAALAVLLLTTGAEGCEERRSTSSDQERATPCKSVKLALPIEAGKVLLAPERTCPPKRKRYLYLHVIVESRRPITAKVEHDGWGPWEYEWIRTAGAGGVKSVSWDELVETDYDRDVSLQVGIPELALWPHASRLFCEIREDHRAGEVLDYTALDVAKFAEHDGHIQCLATRQG